MFYLVMILILIYSLIIIFRFNNIKKHDSVLFDFCQVRRDLMNMLRENNFKIEKEDYFCLRDLLEFLNITIHEYNNLKTSFFNIRKFFVYLKQYEKSQQNIKELKIPDNENILKLYNATGYTLLKAFFTYTPFIKSELFLNLIAFLLRTFSRLWKKHMDNYIETLKQIKNKSQEYGLELRTI